LPPEAHVVEYVTDCGGEQMLANQAEEFVVIGPRELAHSETIER
jgi:hypothetical protein